MSALRRLLQRAEAVAASTPEEDAKREAELRAESDRLAAKEEKAARRLRVLQSNLDRITSELHALIERRLHTDIGYISYKAHRELDRQSARLRAALPEQAAKGRSSDGVVTDLQDAMADQFPGLNIVPFKKEP
ncbi:MAG: hypothetical protein ACLP19_26090 [Xanthobacteraceae bacterium]